MIMLEERRSPGPRETGRGGREGKEGGRKVQEEVLGGRGSVALQVLTHVVALFCAAFAYLHFLFLKSSDSSSSLFLLSHTPLQSGSFPLPHFFLCSLFNEQSMAHASVLSLMWSVQKETAAG